MTAPYVVLPTDVRKDERFGALADAAGVSRREAIGGWVELYCYCADRRLADAPTDSAAYAVSAPVVRRFLGPRGVEGLLADGCDELALGELRPDGLIALRGTEHSVRHLRASRAGGVARASTSHEPRVAGRFVGQLTTEPATPGERLVDGWQEAGERLASGSRGSPAIPDPRSQISDPEEYRNTPPAGARDPAAPAPADPEQARLRRRDVGRTTRELLELERTTVAQALGLPAPLPLTAQDRSEGLLAEYLRTADAKGEPLEVSERMLRHVVAMAGEEARERTELRWLTGAVFEPRNLQRLASTNSGDARREARRRPPSTEVRATPAEVDASRRVLARLSEDTGVAWRVEDGHHAHVVARLREGVAELELRAVATWCGDQWRGKPELVANLKPSTVFGGAKFGEYLAQARAVYADQLTAGAERAGPRSQSPAEPSTAAGRKAT